MSLIWGVTWAAVKTGIAAVPPIFFAAMRYVLVGAALIVAVRGSTALFARPCVRRTVASGALVNIGTYSLLFWGMQFVSSGVAGLLSLALIPIGLFGLSIMVGDEAPRWRHACAVALGVAGLGMLFSNKLTTAGTSGELWGAAAILASTLCYCAGSIMSRKLLTTFTPLQVTAAQGVVGAIGLLALSALLEPLSFDTLRMLASPAPLASLLFLVIGGTLAGYAIYLRLVRDWGAPRAGLYAFVSPVVALLVGYFLLAEPLGWREIAGAATMLTAASLAIPRPT